MLRNFQRLPISLQVIVLFLAALPAWSVTVVGLPWDVIADPLVMRKWIVILTYWAFPILAALAIVLRSIAALPLLAMSMLGFIAHSLLETTSAADGELSPGLRAIRFLLLAITALLSFGLMDRDIVFPFVSRAARFWRVNRRLDVNLAVSVRKSGGSSQAEPLTAMVHDISLGGVGFTVSIPPATEALVIAPGDELVMTARTGPSVRLKTIAVRSHGELLQVGTEALNATEMRQFYDGALDGRRLTAYESFIRTWSRGQRQRVVLALWCLTLGGAAAMPACGTDGPASTRSMASEEKVDPRTNVDKASTDSSQMTKAQWHLVGASETSKLPGVALRFGPVVLPEAGGEASAWFLAPSGEYAGVLLNASQGGTPLTSAELAEREAVDVGPWVLHRIRWSEAPEANQLDGDGKVAIQIYAVTEFSKNLSGEDEGSIETDAGTATVIAWATLSRRQKSSELGPCQQCRSAVVRSVGEPFENYLTDEPYLDVDGTSSASDTVALYGGTDQNALITSLNQGYETALQGSSAWSSGSSGTTGGRTTGGRATGGGTTSGGTTSGGTTSGGTTSGGTTGGGTTGGGTTGGGTTGGGTTGGGAADCCWGESKNTSSCPMPFGNDMSYRYQLEKWPVTTDMQLHCNTLGAGGINRSFVGVTFKYRIGSGDNWMTTPAPCGCVRCGEVTVKVNASQTVQQGTMQWTYPQGPIGTLQLLNGMCAPGCQLPVVKDAQHWKIRASNSPGLSAELLEEDDFRAGSAIFRTHCVPKNLHCD